MHRSKSTSGIVTARRRRSRGPLAISLVLCGLTMGLAAVYQMHSAYSAESGAPKPGQEPLEFGEFLARPDELANVGVNDIARSLRLNAIAMLTGKEVYEKHCASCHGADLKGSRAAHAPDLTDGIWMFSGDDLPSGGMTKFPSDMEWTVRYGVRSGHENARGNEADMLAYDPKFRTEDDTLEFGKEQFLSDEEIADVAEYVLELSSQQFDAPKAARGKVLFNDNAKGNCFDCHTEEGTGNDAIGSQNLTQKNLYLYGSDRATIIESITKGRRGVMPSFEGVLTPSELKAVSIFAFTHARN